MSQRKAPRSGGSPARAVLGVFIALIFAVIGWVLAPSIINALPDASVGSNRLLIQVVIAVIVFFIGLLLSGLILSIFSPKDNLSAREGDLAREKTEMQDRKRAERARKRQSGQSGRR